MVLGHLEQRRHDQSIFESLVGSAPSSHLKTSSVSVLSRFASGATPYTSVCQKLADMTGTVPAQAVTTTVVPIGANSHSAMALLRSWRMQPWDCGVPSWLTVWTGLPSSTGIVWKPIAAPPVP